MPNICGSFYPFQARHISFESSRHGEFLKKKWRLCHMHFKNIKNLFAVLQKSKSFSPNLSLTQQQRIAANGLHSIANANFPLPAVSLTEADCSLQKHPIIAQNKKVCFETSFTTFRCSKEILRCRKENYFNFEWKY